ncbi:hypothetical protein [Fusibacter ferrireducens]|uniref:Uncharacterized protein n=1 Tax=Fusibacter ferrireducens TaxID=2785058 RepID=A0ABR9ZZX6_9FIRM|nr:hypothetical protein [Fusibacter ferrireducens]MBF4695733.1 hypothetical protein [Fusibacter ferrireducens]
MIKKVDHITNYFETSYDLNRIKLLPITDKFRLINYIKLVRRASEIAKEKGIIEITKSEYYDMDFTFHLLISLISSGTDPSVVSEVIEHYAHNFDDSDIYYAKLIVLGSGALMIQKGIDSDSIINYLISLLGDDFLRNNYQRIYEHKEILDLDEENEINIKYKNFDYTYRKLKYDLLALLKIKREMGHEHVSNVVFNIYNNKELKLYFKLLDTRDKSVSEYIYHNLMKTSPKMDRFLLTASRCIINEMSILETHYLFNAIIGKYTRFDKPYSEVMDEIKVREDEILATQ